jgi:hypothetical protein
MSGFAAFYAAKSIFRHGPMTRVCALLVALLLAAPTVAAQEASEDSSTVEALSREVPEPEEDRCPFFVDKLPADCSTSRTGTVSGGYVAADVGLTDLPKHIRRQRGIGRALALELRLGVALWDQLLLGVGGGVLAFNDKRPLHEDVVDCTTQYGQTQCDDKVRSQASVVNVPFLSYELGYHYRLRPVPWLSVAPGAMLSYFHAQRHPHRKVSCDGCDDGERVGLHARGPSVVPFLRVTMGRAGKLALTARSRLFLSGDLRHVTTLGVEYGLP